MRNLTTLLTSLILLLMAGKGYGQTVASAESVSPSNQSQAPTFTPESIFHAPTQLIDYWGDTPIPLSAYTPQELTMQRLLTQQEAAVIAYAPEKEEVFWASRELDLSGQNGIVDALEITPYTWKWVELEMHKADGSELVMRLRRPHQWFWQTGADSLGQTIWIDMPEMGAQGWATVQRIWPQQLDTRLWEEHRQGDYAARPITGRFIHQSEDVWDFYFSHSDSAIGATANHPFWSEDQMAWVEVGQLALGERVRLHGGKTATLTRKVPRPGRHKVYNLEIWRDHNFHVGKGGVWVHNGCPTANKLLTKRLGLRDGMSVSSDAALDLAEDFLGSGYFETIPGSGRYMSADRTRVVRMGDADITGAHGGGPHMNFETLVPNPNKPGKMMVDDNLHIYLKD